MYKVGPKKLPGIFLSLILLCVMVGNASAVTDIYLRADTVMLAVPDGLGGTTNVPMWGFAQETAFGNELGTVTVPGPMIEVPPGETLLRIHVDNNLTNEPISLQINGLMLTNNTGPVWSELGDATVYNPPDRNRPAGNFTARVRSFSHETPPGNTTDVVYEFDVTNRTGTFLYMSGTNPAKQVQMGLYGAVKKDAAAGEAYPGVLYDKEIVILYSEVDPVMAAAINAGTYGPGGTITSSLHRDPKFFLINGKAYDPTSADGGGLDPINSADPVNAGDTVLVRFLNAGYETHVPQLLNMYMNLIAEDGNAYTYPKMQYGVQLPAGKTIDATIIMPTTIGRFSIHDAALNLTNNGTAGFGGMLAFVSTASCNGHDLHPVGAPDGDVDGLDLFEVTQQNPLVVDLGLFAEDFGRANCP